MSQDRLPPPDSEACLVRVRPSSQKGGTLIAEGVTAVATHERRVSDPDGYRPAACPACRGTTLHIHDYRERVLRGEPGRPLVRVVRHVCVGCTAIWQTLPVFLARGLWRTWCVVERVLTGVTDEPAVRWPTVPKRTQRRWHARWRRPARVLVQVLATSGAAAWEAFASGLVGAATCADLVASYARNQVTAVGDRLSAVAALVYRLQPKVRLM